MSEELWIGLLLLAFAIVAAVAWVATRKNGQRRRTGLQRRFGPEYDRAIEEYGSVERAERALEMRAKRVKKLHIVALNRTDREHFTLAWQAAQVRFVDDPSGAVRLANDLVKRVMRARGYPVEDFDQRLADLSVDHADIVQHYRAARTLAIANKEGRANTEELRQALVHYRALFAELLGAATAKAPKFQELRV